MFVRAAVGVCAVEESEGVEPHVRLNSAVGRGGGGVGGARQRCALERAILLRVRLCERHRQGGEVRSGGGAAGAEDAPRRQQRGDRRRRHRRLLVDRFEDVLVVDPVEVRPLRHLRRVLRRPPLGRPPLRDGQIDLRARRRPRGHDTGVDAAAVLDAEPRAGEHAVGDGDAEGGRAVEGRAVCSSHLSALRRGTRLVSRALWLVERGPPSLCRRRRDRRDRHRQRRLGGGLGCRLRRRFGGDHLRGDADAGGGRLDRLGGDDGGDGGVGLDGAVGHRRREEEVEARRRRLRRLRRELLALGAAAAAAALAAVLRRRLRPLRPRLHVAPLGLVARVEERRVAERRRRVEELALDAHLVDRRAARRLRRLRVEEDAAVARLRLLRPLQREPLGVRHRLRLRLRQPRLPRLRGVHRERVLLGELGRSRDRRGRGRVLLGELGRSCDHRRRHLGRGGNGGERRGVRHERHGLGVVGQVRGIHLRAQY